MQRQPTAQRAPAPVRRPGGQPTIRIVGPVVGARLTVGAGGEVLSQQDAWGGLFGHLAGAITRAVGGNAGLVNHQEMDRLFGLRGNGGAY